MKKTGIEGVGSKGSYALDSKDIQMSISHAKDTLEYNLRHAEEHMKKAKEACEKLHKAGAEKDIPKSFLDLVDYFEEVSGHHTQEESRNVDKDATLKSKIKEMYR